MLILRAHALSKPGIAHGFFGRKGGVSEGYFASLNCGLASGDDIARVLENRRRVRLALGADSAVELLSVAQIHSANVVTIVDPWAPSAAPRADAMVTNRPGIALGILAADCAPVLLADIENQVIGAAHAGWGGAFSGVIEAVVGRMTELGADRKRIAAAIGPCIGQNSYEVGPEFEQRFAERDASSRRFFMPSTRAHHWLFDLEAYVGAQLAQAGVTGVEPLSNDTYRHDDKFFSFRRATHKNEAEYGRQISAIMLTR